MLCYHCMREKDDAMTCPYCHVTRLPDSAPHHLVPGSIVGRRYVVGRVLGEGGFGITYIGLDNILRIPVAVKEYFPHGCSHRDNVTSRVIPAASVNSAAFFQKGKDRFLIEARSMARFFREPGIVDVRDFFEENNTAYIVMEYLDGIDLRHYLRKNGVMTPEEAFTMLAPAMETLEKIHKAGLIHRDISPDNIMYLNDGTLKLMDFGAARDYEDENRSMSVMLKPGYAPEEQYRKMGEQGPWTDVYALCATLYRCITGKTPPESNDRLFRDELMRPSELGADISPALENVLLYGLAVRKEDRCQSMTELIALIQDAMSQPHQVVPQPEPEYRPDLPEERQPQPEPEYLPIDPPEPIPDDPYSAFRDEKLSRSFGNFFDKISDRFVADPSSPDNGLDSPNQPSMITDDDPYRALRRPKKTKKRKPTGNNPYLQAIYDEPARHDYLQTDDEEENGSYNQ